MRWPPAATTNVRTGFFPERITIPIPGKTGTDPNGILCNARSEEIGRSRMGERGTTG
jgi:hypothetical protein